MADAINPTIAANAYSRTANSAGGISAGDKVEPSFHDFLVDKTRDVVSVLKEGEAMTVKAVTGGASLPAIVQAINSADTTLKTVVALRDRMISAYQDIMRMPL